MQALYTAVTVLRVLALKEKEAKVSPNSVTHFIIIIRKNNV